MIRNPRQQRAGTARGRILLAASIAAALLALGAPSAIAAPNEPNDPSFSLQWGDNNSGQAIPVDEGNEKFGEPKAGTPGADDRALKAWQVSTGSNSIVIGEADTGVDFEHPDLKANIWSNPGGISGCAAGTHGWDVLNETCEPMDTEPLNTGKGQFRGHGTHVAGIIGAVGNNSIGVAGMNWQTTILPVKWLQAADEDEGVSKLVAALKWFAQAAREGVNIRVVNDSPTFKGTPSTQQIKEEREAIEELAAEKILFVAAAGNTHENNDEKSGRYPCRLGLPNEICVTATNNEDKLPSWANYGPHTVDLAAPGVSIYSTLREEHYGYLSGGSMAAAQVSGAAALILSVAPSLSPEALKADIVNNVDKLSSLSGKVISGGRLNVCRALPGCEPTVTSVSPNKGPAAGGTSVTITGTNLNGATAVNFRASEGTITSVVPNSVTPTSVTATAPNGTGTVDVTVTTPRGASAVVAEDRFTYVPPPSVTSVSPGAGPPAGGTSVTITGSNLGEEPTVRFGTSNAVITNHSAISITAKSPSGTGTVDVTVTTPGGTTAASAHDQFSYLPTVSSVSPSMGPVSGGTSVTITGTNLAEATAVKFGSTNASSFKVGSPTSITATSPAGSGILDVTVTTPGGTSATGPTDQFTYVPEIAPTPAQTQSPGTTTSLGPSGPGQSSVLGTTTVSSAVVLATTTLTVQHRGAAVRLRCVGSSACRGTLAITVKLEVHQHGKPTKTRVLTIGRAGLSLSAGQTASFTVPLTSNGRRLLSAAHGRLSALLTIVKSATGPSSAQSKHVHLTLRASSPKKSGGVGRA